MSKEFPHLLTDRLCLNKLQSADIDAIVEMAGNKNVSKNTLNIPHPYKPEHAEAWLSMIDEGFEKGTITTFGIRLHPDQQLIGAIGLRIEPRFNRAELGYWIGEAYWNKGYATEALAAALKFGFLELKLNKILATHLVENPASGRVMIKNGMIKEGELKEHILKNDVYLSLVQYRLTRAEYLGLNH